MILNADAVLTAMVAGRIRPSNVSQYEKESYIVYDRIGTPRYNDLSGPDGTSYPSIQFTAFAMTRRTARLIAKRVRDILDGYETKVGTKIQCIHFEDNGVDLTSPFQVGDGSFLKGVALTATVTCDE